MTWEVAVTVGWVWVCVEGGGEIKVLVVVRVLSIVFASGEVWCVNKGVESGVWPPEELVGP